MSVPIPTPIYRFIHVDNLEVYLHRGGLHAPNHTPANGLSYKTIHDIEIQQVRRTKTIGCGPDGVIHDYVSFYFGYRSPMLFKLKTGQVQGYHEGQEPLIYLVSSAQKVVDAGVRFVFSDGHGIAAISDWYDDLSMLDKVDWNMVYERYWVDRVDDMDRQRRKQAEFLIYKFCDWQLIQSIAVINANMKSKVETILNGSPMDMRRPVNIRSNWYYQ
jgi:hypothetical protein